MAWKLQLPTSGFITIPTWTVFANQDFVIDIVFDTPSVLATDGVLGRADSADYLAVFATGGAGTRFNGAFITSTVTSVFVPNNRFRWRVQRVSNVCRVTITNLTTGVVRQDESGISMSAGFNFTWIGSTQSFILDGGSFYTVELSRSGDNRYYDANASGGTGIVYPDTINSANNGTQTGSGWTAANWVFYNSITALPIPNNTLGAALNQPCQINLNNIFTGATSYSVLSGSLPAGLSISGNQIIGTPTTAQSTTLVIRAANSIDVLDSATITFNTGLWYLNNASDVDSRINIPSVVIGATVGDYIELRAVANAGNPNNFYRLAGLQVGSTDSVIMEPTRLVALINNNTATFSSGYSQPAVGSVFALRLTKTLSNQWTASLNGNSIGQFTLSTNLTLTAFGSINSSATQAFRGGFYHIEISTNGGASATRYYDPNTSGGVGNLLIDRVSNQNGTQAGTWPADNSEWVSYAPAGETFTSTTAWAVSPMQWQSAADATAPALASTAAWSVSPLVWQSSAAVTAPTFSSSATWSITPLNWQSTASATVPAFQSTTAWQITPLQWQAQAASTAPGAIASAAAWTISPLQWQAQAQPAPVFQAAVAWSISPMRWQSTAVATVPQFQSSAAWSVSPLQWQGSATATAPGATASTINWSITPLQWQGQASATVPTFDASAAWQITPLVWRVSASIGGEPVFTAKGASITERFQSRAIIERLQTARIIQ